MRVLFLEPCTLRVCPRFPSRFFRRERPATAHPFRDERAANHIDSTDTRHPALQARRKVERRRTPLVVTPLAGNATTPPKVEEAAEPASTEETPAKKAEAAPAVEPTPAAEPSFLGDVVPAAVTVGQAPKSTPEVSAAA